MTPNYSNQRGNRCSNRSVITWSVRVCLAVTALTGLTSGVAAKRWRPALQTVYTEQSGPVHHCHQQLLLNPLMKSAWPGGRPSRSRRLCCCSWPISHN